MRNISLILLTGLFFSFNALALTPLDKGIYLGINGGYGKVDQRAANSNKQDNAGLSGTAYVGYKFQRYYGVEAGFNMFHNGTFDSMTTDNNYSVDLAFKGILPFNKTGFSLFAKVGPAVAFQRRWVSGSNREFAGFTYFAAFGAAFAVTKNIEINTQGSVTGKNGPVPAMYLISGGVSYILPAF